MTRTWLALTVGIVALTAPAGCGEDDSAADRGSEIGRELGEGVDAARAEAGELRERMAQTAEDQMDRADEMLADLRARAQTAEDQSRQAIDNAIAEIERRRTELREQLAELRAAGSDAWQRLSEEVSRSADALGQALRDAAAEFDGE